MLQNVFIAMLLIGILYQVLTIKWESWPLAILSSIWFLKLMVDSYNIQVVYTFQPFVNGSTIVPGEIGVYSVADGGLSAILLVFVFINIVLAIVYWSTTAFKNPFKN